MQTTIERVRAVFEECFGPSALQDCGDSNPIWVSGAIAPAGQVTLQEGDLDSLDKIEFMMAVEEEFGVEIGDDVARDLDTLEKISGHVDVLLSSRVASPH